MRPQVTHQGFSVNEIVNLSNHSTLYFFQAHYIKATAFRSIGQSEDALREFLYCVALKADWITVKLEAQKVHTLNLYSVFL